MSKETNKPEVSKDIDKNGVSKDIDRPAVAEEVDEPKDSTTPQQLRQAPEATQSIVEKPKGKGGQVTRSHKKGGSKPDRSQYGGLSYLKSTMYVLP